MHVVWPVRQMVRRRDLPDRRRDRHRPGGRRGPLPHAGQPVARAAVRPPGPGVRLRRSTSTSSPAWRPTAGRSRRWATPWCSATTSSACWKRPRSRPDPERAAAAAVGRRGRRRLQRRRGGRRNRRPAHGAAAASTPTCRRDDVRVTLLDGGDRILPELPPIARRVRPAQDDAAAASTSA